MGILVKVICVLVGMVIGLCGALFFKGDCEKHNETMESQHYAIYQEVRETKAKVVENGSKLDILLNIATNTDNRDFR